MSNKDFEKELEEALKQLELDFGDDLWDDDFALMDYAGSLPDLPNSDLYCDCKEPDIVKSQAYGESFDYCRSCKKEKK